MYDKTFNSTCTGIIKILYSAYSKTSKFEFRLFEILNRSFELIFGHNEFRELSVVEYLSQDRGVAGLSLTCVTALCP